MQGIKIVVAVGLALVSITAGAATLAEVVEPGVTVRWEFGGPAASKTALGVQLNYSGEIRHGFATALGSADTTLERRTELHGPLYPALTQWTYHSGGLHTVQLNGLVVGAGILSLNEAEPAGDQTPATPERKSGSFWGGNVALMVIATGAALALIVNEAGEAAEENNPAMQFGNNNSSGSCPNGVDVNGNCVGGG